MNYNEAKEKLGTRTTRKLGNNTYLQMRDAHTIALKLHATDVLTFKADGSTILNSGGWRTHTTKDRINAYLPDRFYLNQHAGVWYLMQHAADFNTRQTLGRFDDGMTIHSDGRLTGILPLMPKLAAIDRNKKKEIKAYCGRFVEALEAGQVSSSTAGDCWYCLLRETETHTPMGELTRNVDHLDNHIKENYFVLSLLQRAFETFGASIAMRSYVGNALNGGDRSNVFAPDVMREDTARFLYRYMCRQYGYAA